MRKVPVLLLFIFGSFVSQASAQIVVENEDSMGFGTVQTSDPMDTYTLDGFDMGAGDKILVAVGNEGGTPASFGVTFNGTEVPQIVFSTDASSAERSHLYMLDGASGVGDIVVTMSQPGELIANGCGIYAVSLSGAEVGVETSGSFGNGMAINGDLTGVMSGVSQGAYVLSVFTDQGNPQDVTVTGDLVEVGLFGGANRNENGSGTVAAASGFGTGSDLTVTFSDNSVNNTPFQNRSNFAYMSVSATPADCILADVSGNGIVDFNDIPDFVTVLLMGPFQCEADCDENGIVDFNDIPFFVDILLSP